MSKSWGDVDNEDDDEGEQKDSIGSPMAANAASNVSIFESGPDKDGIKTITEFRTNEAGKKVRIIRKVKVTRKLVKVNKHVLARRKWAKFGDAEGTTKAKEANVTYVSYENINLALAPRNREDKVEDDPLLKLKSNASVVKCSNCGETGHWTLKCPKRDQIKAKGVPDGPTGKQAAAKSDTRAPATGPTKYVPMHMREGADKMAAARMDRDDSTTLRVTNLSEDTTEDDLRELFRTFGHTTRTYLAKDRQSGQSRGFAFVSYATMESCYAAINALHGHGYDNLILHVEFAKPREEKEAGTEPEQRQRKPLVLRHAGQRD